MSRQSAQFGMPLASSTRSTTLNRTSRPIMTTTGSNVSALTRAFQSGSMNISTASHHRTRAASRVNQPSPERAIKTNLTTTQRSRLTSQDRKNSLTNGLKSNYAERQVSNPTVTIYSIAAAPVSTDYTTPTSTFSNLSPTDRRISQGTVPTEERRFSHVNVTTNERRKSYVNASANDRRISQSNIPVVEPSYTNGGLCGLQNLGNTCFMNSVLQCLSNTKPLLLFCLREGWEDQLNTSSTSVMKGVLMKEYASLIHRMWCSSEGRSIVSPLSFKNTIGEFAPRFTGYSEQDSQEFLRYLLQGLSEDVNRVQQKPVPLLVDEKAEERMKEKDRAKASWERCLRYENSHLVDIFAGQLKSTLECSHCQYRSITFDMFWDLSLPLPRDKSSTTLQECLQLFMSKEELNGNEKPMCAQCKQKRPCTKQLSLQKCPQILVLHLKRFSQMRGRTKLNTHVDFPITNLRLADLPDVISESHEGAVPTYNLFGISNHSGSIYTGHYIAQCKHPFTNEWREFNDSSVHLISDNSKVISANAYVLFYERNRS